MACVPTSMAFVALRRLKSENITDGRTRSYRVASLFPRTHDDCCRKLLFPILVRRVTYVRRRTSSARLRKKLRKARRSALTSATSTNALAATASSPPRPTPPRRTSTPTPARPKSSSALTCRFTRSARAETGWCLDLFLI